MRKILSVIMLAAAAPLRAQAPAHGADSARAVPDTIYALAVDPAEHAGEDFIYLLDDGVLRFEADGRGSRTYRQVIQVLSRDAAELWGEHTFGYDASRERLKLNWARVVGPDGRVIAAEPAHVQEADAPAAESSPVFTDQKLLRISLGGVVPGTIVDYSYTVETLDPVMPGSFFSGWSVTTGRLTRRSRLVVDVPAKLEPKLRERNLSFARRVEERDGRRVYVWAASDVPKVEPEPFAADSNAVYQSIAVGAPIAWEGVARWYHGLSHDRYALTPEIEAEVARLVAGAASLEDSLRAVHRWVAQDFRYVSLSLGIGGYRPRLPQDVFATRYGDCKDKATLFIAVARKLGLRAHPVLLGQGGGIDRSLPSPQQFDHMIAAVERPGGQGYMFFDLTAELTPYGELPPGVQGGFALLVRPDGRGEELVLPEDPPEANRSAARLTGELSPDGLFSGWYEETAAGTQQYGLRSAFGAPRTAKELEEVRRNLASSLLEGAVGDSLVAFDGRDTKAPPRIALRLHGGRIAMDAGGTRILTLPLPNFSSQDVITELEAKRPRRFPIDVAAVVGPHDSEWELRLTLPPGWKAKLPDGIQAESEFGRYEAVYEQKGRELRIVRRIRGRTGVQPPERVDALIAWLRELSKDDVRFIRLETPGEVAAAKSR